MNKLRIYTSSHKKNALQHVKETNGTLYKSRIEKSQRRHRRTVRKRAAVIRVPEVKPIQKEVHFFLFGQIPASSSPAQNRARRSCSYMLPV
mmetsp:Transcript_11840/g.17729  ORF Transcript_11840/g.17729 Transcript_11840/m.17729 type:complete len:91 (-) Transcript_11840:548-820(-)